MSLEVWLFTYTFVLLILLFSACLALGTATLEGANLKGEEVDRSLGLLGILETEHQDGEEHTFGVTVGGSSSTVPHSKPASRTKQADKTQTIPHEHHNDEEVNDRILFLLDNSNVSGPRYCQVEFGKLSWNADTTYEDLLACACTETSVMGLEDFLPDEDQKAILLIHQVPKTASTSQRKILQRNRRDCPSDDQHLPDTTCRHTPKLMQICPQLGTFLYWTQAVASKEPLLCFDYEKYDASLANRQYLHAIPFRNFNEWAVSALDQILKRQLEEDPGRLQIECDKLRRMFEPDLCLPGVHELSYRRYSKPILRFVLAETPPSDPVILYNFADSSNYIMGTLLNQLGQEPLELEYSNTEHSNASCFDSTHTSILDKFHSCFDHMLEQGGS